MRAPRFPLCLTARYRPLGNEEWLRGETRNISASGVLLLASAPLQVNTRVEVQLVLASEKTQRPPGEVACLGRVVRINASADRQPTEFAIAIEQFNFLHPGSRVLKPDVKGGPRYEA